MAPIRIKWDPEILEGGYIPSSIFDELEANVTMASTTMAPVERVVERVVALVANTITPLINTTTTVSTITAPATVAGTQNTTEMAFLAHNIAGVNSTVVKDVVKKAAAMVLNITAPVTTTPPITTTITSSSGIYDTTTILPREVDHVAWRPEAGMVQVVIIFIVSIILVCTGQRYRNNIFFF